MKKALSLSLAAALALSMLSGCTQTPTAPAASSATPAPSQSVAPAPVAEPVTYADTVAWDGEYDVIVVGFGGAGAAAASYAAREGASVLVTEKAPEGHEGGNSKVCGQLIVTAKDKDKAMEYYRQLAGASTFPEAEITAYVDGMLTLPQLLMEDFGVEQVYSGLENPVVAPSIPEYPEFAGCETIDLVTVTPQISNSALYNTLRQDVLSRNDNIDVWYEAPGTRLIQDPVSNTILGVQIEKQGKPVNIRALNGVVLATGGFENNQEMRETYLGLPRAAVAGGLYNTGDGVRMAQEVGADLWHMDVWEGVAGYGGSSFVVGEDEHASLMVNPGNYRTGSLILVDDKGDRFLNESDWPRHGHVAMSGSWHHPIFPDHYYLVYDQAQKDTFDQTGAIFDAFQDQVQSADTLDALAQQLGMSSLSATVDRYNGFAKTGEDLAFNREAATMTAIGAGPYYAIELMPLMLNTQGGPRRNAEAQIVGIDGDPIPHLYSAGELGGVTAHLYQGGGNMTECLVYGKIAGVNAAAPKNETLPVLPGKVDSNLVYTPGNDPDNTGDKSFETGADQYLGTSDAGMGGTLTVRITMDGDKLTAVEVVDHTETDGIGTQAIDTVPGSIVSANSTEVDGVSGATMTSNAIREAVNDALSQVK